MGFLSGIMGGNNTTTTGSPLSGITITTSPYNQQYAGSIGGIGIGAGQGNAVNAVYQIPSGVYQVQNQLGQANVIYPGQLVYPTGTMVSVVLIDARGYSRTIEVDSGVAHLIDQINQAHCPVSNHGQPRQLDKMVENDFSMDELEQAETLLEELNGRSKTRELAEDAA